MENLAQSLDRWFRAQRELCHVSIVPAAMAAVPAQSITQAILPIMASCTQREESRVEHLGHRRRARLTGFASRCASPSALAPRRRYLLAARCIALHKRRLPVGVLGA